MQNKRFVGIMMTAAILLLIPFVARQFTDEVKWTLFDFVVMGVLLFGTGLILEFALRKVNTLGSRIAVCVAILVAFLIVWAELAVGIFGTPFAGT